jgi:hypothetical protein
VTWVIGAATMAGQGIMISDVRISFRDGTETDLLRKSYPVGPYILAGFAGSVKIGMALIASLKESLQMPKNETGYWSPEWVTEQWSPIAAQVFAESEDEEKGRGCQILMVGLTQQPDADQPPIPQVSLITINGPQFLPTIIRRAEVNQQVCHIGSGADVQDYKDQMSEFFRMIPGAASSMSSTDAWSPDMTLWRHILGAGARERLLSNRVPGISPHLHIHVSQIGQFSLSTNDERLDDRDGEAVDFKMPRVASTYEEFCALCAERGMAAACAKA